MRSRRIPLLRPFRCALALVLIAGPGATSGCAPTSVPARGPGANAAEPAPGDPPGARPLRVALRVPARGDTASVLLYVPPEQGNGRLWPTILYLHGGSHRGTDLERLKAYGPPRLVSEGRDLPFILIAPQLPEGEIWSDADLLIALIDELSARYPIDPDRLYVTGMSMGGRGAWYLAYRYPDRFAAIAPVAAFQPIAYWATSGRLRAVPVRAYHGEQDPLAPVGEARELHAALGAGGGSSELVELPGRDHFISDVFQDPELYRWLLRHRRAAPRDAHAAEERSAGSQSPSAAPAAGASARAPAHRAQTQARPRCDSGIRASAAGSMSAPVHQHGVARVPLAAGAHAFGPPHSGQVRLGSASMAERRRVSRNRARGSRSR